MFGLGSWGKTPERRCRRWALGLGLTLLLPALAWGQSRVWTTESVDTSGMATSLAVDHDGNVHISYGPALKYGFRPADQSHWFTMPIDGRGTNHTSLMLDQQGNPHVCATYAGLRYAHFDGKKWTVDTIGSDYTMTIQYACAVAVAPDGSQYLTWYNIESVSNPHLRYGVLKDGAWMVRTLDWDMQTGKWHSMVLNSQGNPYVSYDAYVKGLLKCAHWDGQNWKIRIVDSRGSHGSDYSIGMGSSIALDLQDNPHISYYTTNELRYAQQQKDTWKIETVDTVSPDHGAHEYRSSLIFDKNGFPHISYENLGVLKHAYWDGKGWRVEVIASSGPVALRYSSMAFDSNRDILYLCYQDAIDGALKVAIGRFIDQPQTNVSQKKMNPK